MRQVGGLSQGQQSPNEFLGHRVLIHDLDRTGVTFSFVTDAPRRVISISSGYVFPATSRDDPHVLQSARITQDERGTRSYMDGVARQVVAVLILARSVNHRVPHLPVLGVRKCEVDGFGRRVD